ILQNCPGTVVLQDVDAQVPSTAAVQVENCARAVLLDSRVIGGVLAQDSTLWIANAEITGGHITYLGRGGGARGPAPNSVLHVWRTSIRGGDNRSFSCEDFSVDGGPGILAVDSTVNLFGGPSSLVAGGWGGSSGDGFFCFPDPSGPGLKLTGNSHARIQ